MSKSQTKEDWQKNLSTEQYNVCWNKATELPFSGKYVHCKKQGAYYCVCCNNSLFNSDTKYDSGSGWPSFWDVESNTSIEEISDNTHGMKRVEVVCQNCQAHLGHVFTDGPQPTGLRYCINSASLGLKET